MKDRLKKISKVIVPEVREITGCKNTDKFASYFLFKLAASNATFKDPEFNGVIRCFKKFLKKTSGKHIKMRQAEKKLLETIEIDQKNYLTEVINEEQFIEIKKKYESDLNTLRISYLLEEDMNDGKKDSFVDTVQNKVDRIRAYYLDDTFSIVYFEDKIL